MSSPVPRANHILLWESQEGELRSLAGRVASLGIDPVRVARLEDAVRELEDPTRLITAVMIAAELGEEDLKAALKSLRRAGPASGLTLVAVGAPPDPSVRKRLRSARVKLALWEPFDEGALRFQMNRALTGDREEHARSDVRVPTYLLARVMVGERNKDAVVYSLSVGGAFLETPRASMDGAQIEVELRLPDAPLLVQAKVMFANVPGNLQRPNLPMGMGVCFEDLSAEAKQALADYVEQRMSQLEV